MTHNVVLSIDDKNTGQIDYAHSLVAQKLKESGLNVTFYQEDKKKAKDESEFTVSLFFNSYNFARFILSECRLCFQAGL